MFDKKELCQKIIELYPDIVTFYISSYLHPLLYNFKMSVSRYRCS